MKKRIVFLIGIISGMLLFGQIVCASEIEAVPSTHSLRIRSENINEKFDDVPSYVYNGNNYFMLRDIGKITGYRIEWNVDTKTVLITKDAYLRNPFELNSANDTANGIENAQTIIADGYEYKDMPCLNIDGYNYFKLRDLEEIMGFSCEWNDKTKTIMITLNAEYTVNVPLDDIHMPRENRTIIDEDIFYLPNSGDYRHIEKYMQEHIDPNFKADDYIITEEYNVSIPGSLLTLRLNVNGVYTLDFAYWIACINRKMAVMASIGEINLKFDLEKAGVPRLSDKEAKKMALEADNVSSSVAVEQRIYRYFSMEELAHKCEVETVYRDETGGYFCLNNKFLDHYQDD